MQTAICNLSCAPVRRHGDILSEMVSQLIFGEAFEVLETGDGPFGRIRSQHDGYEGWVDLRQSTPISDEEFEALGKTPPVISAAPLAEASSSERKIFLPGGSILPFYDFDSATIRVGSEKLSVEGPITNTDQADASASAVLAQTATYKNAPYLWGGRTPLGIDCSGLVQVIYRSVGVHLPRDCSEQIHEGTAIENVSQSQPGDIAFFKYVADGGPHVGIISEDGIIHASGLVREDDLDDTGIRNRESGAYSHHITAIRRLLD